jgi:hypothetical protein
MKKRVLRVLAVKEDYSITLFEQSLAHARPSSTSGKVVDVSYSSMFERNSCPPGSEQTDFGFWV